ncbi:MAG: signal peptidase II [Myxococcales bacterium]|nr:signal peptidase II [Myxococcales bacterium]
MSSPPPARTLLFACVALTLGLDLWSKQWAIEALANVVHPLAVPAGAQPEDHTVAAAFARRGVSAGEFAAAVRNGLVVRAHKWAGRAASSAVQAEDVGLDLTALQGSGFPAPRRAWVRQQDVGQSLAEVAAKAWRVDAAAVQSLFDAHTVQTRGTVADPTAPREPGVTYLLRERTISVIDGYFSYVYAENPGAAWSFLATAPAGFRHVLFVVISLVASLAMGWTLWQGRMGTAWSSWALAAILGGALGNLVDRLRFHVVVDFVYNFVVGAERVYGWPVYNVADIGITAGVIAIALEMVLAKRPVDASAVAPPAGR